MASTAAGAQRRNFPACVKFMTILLRSVCCCGVCRRAAVTVLVIAVDVEEVEAVVGAVVVDLVEVSLAHAVAGVAVVKSPAVGDLLAEYPLDVRLTHGVR